MVKGRGCPRYGGVALRAVRREVRRDVVGVRSALEILEVTGYASRAGQVVVIVDVTIGALARRHRMSTAQRESHRIVIELGIHPVIAGMAGITIGGKFSANVIGIGGGLKIFEVTRRAGRGHRLEVAGRAALVTSFAIDGGMRSRQREAIVVLLDLLHRYLPPSNCVALFTIRSQLPLMDVCVAVLALLAHIRKDRLRVTLYAAHTLMHSAQWVPRPIVIKFGHCADWSPRACGVAVLAWHRQISVRAASSARNLALRHPRICRTRQQGYCNDFEYAAST
jgi:hypothetical protein